jgi:major membrane immunogen (membrane-anchored lipoprotein)
MMAKDQNVKRQYKIKYLLWVMLLIAALTLSACGSRDPLMGTWMEPNSGVVMEITDDGKVSMTLNGASITLEYTTEDPDVIIILGTADGSIPEQRMTYRVKEDKLVLTLDGVNTSFFRVK